MTGRRKSGREREEWMKEWMEEWREGGREVRDLKKKEVKNQPRSILSPKAFLGSTSMSVKVACSGSSFRDLATS